MRNHSKCVSLLLLTIALVAASPVAAQDYPKKQIELVVPFVAGGTTDNIARLIAQRFTESWSQTVIVNNRPGGGSTIGHQVVVKAPPDGHTLLVTTISFAITAAVQKLPFDPIKDFAPITELASLPLILVVHPSLPATNLASSSRSRSRSRADGISPPRAPGRRRISPPRCSNPWPASIWCTCRTKATPRP